MKKLSNLLSLFLAVIFILSVPMNVQAIGTSSRASSIQDAVEIIKNANPDAEIEVIDGIIHVNIAVNQMTSPQNHREYNIQSNEATTIYAPNGGSWRDFAPPSYMTPGSGYTIPYCVIYLPGDKAEALFHTMSTTGLWDFILDNPLESAGAEAIKTKILQKFGISLSTIQIVFLYSASCVYLYDTVNKNSLDRAMSETSAGKVRIDYTTINDVPANYYYSWSGNNVTNHPWQEFEPTFYEGYYCE